MANLHFIGGEKGGVGKSFTSRLLAQYYIDNKKAFVGFDTDLSHETFTRFYGEFINPIVIHSVESLDQILGEAENYPQQDIIVDLAAQSAAPLRQWMQDCDLLGLMKELGFTVIYWHIMDDGADSAYLLTKLTKLLKPDNDPDNNCTIIAIKNLGRGDDFSLYEQTPLYAKALAAGVKFASIPKLQPYLVQKIDFHHLSFWAAAHNTQTISLIERRRVKLWLDQCYKVFSALLPFSPTNSQSAANAAHNPFPTA
jgi:hypothetical protein